MRTSFNVIFFIRKDKTRKNGKAPINCRITINKEIANFNIHQEVNPALWDAKANRVSGKSSEAILINGTLDNYKSIIYQKYKEILERDNFVTPEKLKNSFLGISEDNTMLLELFYRHNKDVEALVGIDKSKATLQKYKVTYTRLKDFMKMKYNISDINIKEINLQFVTDFEIYLRTICECNSNTTAKFMQFFKRIITIAKNNGWIQKDPFINYKIRIQRVDRGYLTEKELKIIASKKIKIKRLEQVRDIFLFSCYTGLAYIDVYNLTYDNIQTGVDGKLWIMNKRQKTNTNVTVPLMDIPLSILEKYKHKQKNNKVLPSLSNQKLNTYLKEIADICEINKTITFHTARHRKSFNQMYFSVLQS